MKLNFSYNESRDILITEGIPFSGDFFRAWAEGGLNLYEPFQIIKRADGVVTVRRLTLRSLISAAWIMLTMKGHAQAG